MNLVVLKQKIADELVKIKLIKQLRKENKRFILVGTPLHGNLGDQAITLAEYKYLKDNFEDRSIIEIPRYYFELFEGQFKKYIKKTDVILIPGGGSLGTLWIAEEYFVRKIIQRYSDNAIVIFPQTVFYAEDKGAKLELKKSEEIYNNHGNLCICAREKFSYEFMRKHYKQCKILYTPDIVLYLLDKLEIEERVRQGVLLCFRKDKEKQIDDETIEQVMGFIENMGERIIVTDTVVKSTVYTSNREEELEKIWRVFSTSKLVITDRLHGMIFAAITGTPCIVFRNSNHKVEGVYKWIKELDYIQLVNNVEDVKIFFSNLFNKESKDKISLEKSFESLTETIKSVLLEENI